MIEDKELEIDGETFRIAPFPAFKGLVYLKKLTKIVGPSIATMFGGEEATELADLSSAEKAVELLVQNFDGDGVETLIKDLVASVTKNGQPLVFDIEFQANYGKLLKLVVEVVKVNYGSVFQLGGLLNK
tara:strand:- start:12493 stop:12879 length:387 start_codon:yes stop_codon:yes gene_type:complete